MRRFSYLIALSSVLAIQNRNLLPEIQARLHLMNKMPGKLQEHAAVWVKGIK